MKFICRYHNAGWQHSGNGEFHALGTQMKSLWRLMTTLKEVKVKIFPVGQRGLPGDRSRKLTAHRQSEKC